MVEAADYSDKGRESKSAVVDATVAVQHHWASPIALESVSNQAMDEDLSLV